MSCIGACFDFVGMGCSTVGVVAEGWMFRSFCSLRIHSLVVLLIVRLQGLFRCVLGMWLEWGSTWCLWLRPWAIPIGTVNSFHGNPIGRGPFWQFVQKWRYRSLCLRISFLVEWVPSLHGIWLRVGELVVEPSLEDLPDIFGVAVVVDLLDPLEHRSGPFLNF